jgi:hypothetical protein
VIFKEALGVDLRRPRTTLPLHSIFSSRLDAAAGRNNTWGDGFQATK